MGVQMTDEEKKQRIAQLRAELKELQATPRSDWHKAFEAILRITTDRYKDVTIRTEVELGVDPPRTDYVILTGSETQEFEESIFKIFRKINILEYKNPNDALNMRTIYKICGYAYLMIGLAEHEGDVPPEDVTLSIFRSTKNKELFKALEENGQLQKTQWHGIYNLTGITPLPFQIVITSELEGLEYVAFRALTDKASKDDVEDLMDVAKMSMEERLRMYYRVVLDLVSEKNKDITDEIMRSNIMEYQGMLRYFEDEIDRRSKDDIAKARQETDEANARANKAIKEANNAKDMADKAKKDADNAKDMADKAKKDADNAKDMADKAKKEVENKDNCIARAISSVMSHNNYSLEKAMDFLSIPLDEKPLYESMIKQL